MPGCSERWTAAVVFLALFVCVASPLPAGPLPATGVLDALAEPDGSAVSLKAVSVQKTASDPPHIVVSDPCHYASPTPSELPAASCRRNNVNGGKFDPVDYDWDLRVPFSEANMYPFRLLKAAIAGIEE